VKWHGVLFKDPMARAVRENKRVTRRVEARWAKVRPGDRIWVREVWADCPDEPTRIEYRADGDPTRKPLHTMAWKSSMVMPMRACRTFLAVVSVEMREEDPVLAVDDAEAALEGFPSAGAFAALWLELHPDRPLACYRIAFEPLPIAKARREVEADLLSRDLQQRLGRGWMDGTSDRGAGS
jgi:hypothetical protein